MGFGSHLSGPGVPNSPAAAVARPHAPAATGTSGGGAPGGANSLPSSGALANNIHSAHPGPQGNSLLGPPGAPAPALAFGAQSTFGSHAIGNSRNSAAAAAAGAVPTGHSSRAPAHPPAVPPAFGEHHSNSSATGHPSTFSSSSSSSVTKNSNNVGNSNSSIGPVTGGQVPPSTHSNNNVGNSISNSSADNKPKPSLGTSSSWAQFSKSAQSSNKTSVSKDTFAAFKKQAKDKEDKQKFLLEQQEKMRKKKAEEERDRQRMEQERLREKEEDEALERARRSAHSAASAHFDDLLRTDTIGSPSPSSQGSASPAQSLSERDRLRKLEAERRRRKAVSTLSSLSFSLSVMH